MSSSRWPWCGGPCASARPSPLFGAGHIDEEPGSGAPEIEKLYGLVRTAEVAGGDESVVLFGQWLEAREDGLLEGIRAYNDEDCRSTVALHDWFLGLRPDGLPWWLPPEEREKSEEAEERDTTRIALHEALLAGGALGTANWLLARLLHYRQREAKSQWWGCRPSSVAEARGYVSPRIVAQRAAVPSARSARIQRKHREILCPRDHGAAAFCRSTRNGGPGRR